MASQEQPKTINHIIGSARTIQTAVLVVEYLKAGCAHPHSNIQPAQIKYRFKDPTPSNGWWSAEIIVETYAIDGLSLDDSSKFVSICRAFVAGRGEIWV